MVKNLFRTATEVISGIRALPAIHTLAQESTDAAISERATIRAGGRANDLERKIAEQTKEIENLRAARAIAENALERSRADAARQEESANELRAAVSRVTKECDALGALRSENERLRGYGDSAIAIEVTRDRMDELSKWQQWGQSVLRPYDLPAGVHVLTEVKRIVFEMKKHPSRIIGHTVDAF